MDNQNIVVVSIKPDDEVIYYTSDSVQQKKIVKEMSYFDNKIGFFIEPGETAIVPVAQTKASHSLVVNIESNTHKSLLLSSPQYVDGSLNYVVMKNHSRVRVVMFDDTPVAELVPLTKPRGVSK